jgi:uncharacterized protein with FMN-binding domain
MEIKSSNKYIGIVIGAFAVLGIAAFGFSPKKDLPPAAPAQPEQPTTAPVASEPSVPPVKTTPQVLAAMYKNGTYTAAGSYMSPGGLDDLSITLTLKSDVVTDVSMTPDAHDHRSEQYQAKFMSGYKTYVVGKNIADIQVGKVSGSSLTGAGFNDALAKIKAQAKV